MTRHNANYFLKKFRAIPEDQWCMREYQDRQGRRCAFGHCGDRDGDKGRKTLQGMNMEALFLEALNCLSPASVNDGTFDTAHLGDSPKERILVALENIKGGGW